MYIWYQLDHIICMCVCISGQMFEIINELFYRLLKSVFLCPTKLHLFDQKYSKTVILWNIYFNTFYNVIYSLDGKAEFLAAITQFFCVTRSFLKSSNLILIITNNWIALTVKS